MQVHIPLLAIAVILVASIESKPTWHDVYVSNYPSTGITVQQPQLLQYQNAYSPYYLSTDTLPAAVIAGGKSSISHIPTYSFYYGPSIYDLRLPLAPVYPTVKPHLPEQPLKPTLPTTTTTTEATGEKEDGIEKLDNKEKPEKPAMEPTDMEESTDDNAVTIESL
ncbi:PREDICTED: uncharacterized protein LOC107190995 [Dufourea novaeangliae]|uniref:DUF4794 domain-containing protein n=1 Tax=Dufourea novaeangliae TaxID=178035 RepID=A0A154PLT8_DUFNO|nr:PREDICTED: uncharacterized protein LOC107190995 [Dufourea novaeangliae]KZC12845.1 hypothetical protein WN55_04362 [Dufourea novaeangliae]